MKRISALFLLISLLAGTAFAKEIQKKDAVGAVNAARIVFNGVKRQGLKEYAPQEMLSAERALNQAQKELKEEEWVYAYREAMKVRAYVDLVKAIYFYKKAEKELQDFKRKL